MTSGGLLIVIVVMVVLLNKWTDRWKTERMSVALIDCQGTDINTAVIAEHNSR